jgi:two-component system phosphate regulon response regulator PhoB/two-component system alkaline phosphatase synthesis response regulator PhoP/two-component system response regulator VicR
MSAGKDILIIEDDRDLVDTFRIVLESKNYEVRAAYDGKEGYSRIEEKLPDLIILDVMMATDTEGFDLAYKLQNKPKFRDIPIVMVTSFPQAMAQKGPEKFQHILGESWPVSFFIEKPVDPEKLLTTIENILQEENQK